MTTQPPDVVPESADLILNRDPLLAFELGNDDSLPASSIDQIDLKIRRQDDPFSKPYWQQFRLPCQGKETITALLRKLRNQPVTIDGETVDPVAFDHNCMEEVCGACAILINGKPRMACSALIEEFNGMITLEPLSKFPIIRDLIVDRSRMFAHLKRVKAWITLDGTWETQQPPLRMSPHDVAVNYLYSRCMYCGCCMAACPQYDENQEFVGPATLAQVRLLNHHPLGQYEKTERLHRIMTVGGLSDCGNAQNCVRVCPKEIPLTTAIGELGRAVTWQLFKDLFGD
ncbi:succinate dehydrogenase iron-sulfur subunit [Rhodoferax sp. 4810]|uniref:succinate dehydrogenase n=1 Tax=Thiospirillum jenense TaxID=1653858 RepID=A0A839HCY2_9GAMM|nr:succinate dehydrogenase iron-sulfur subunit [Thiospirillum jenense]MBB1074192.1 succinate dehydrogenase iron-sulfur subunit [Rhodoferax jenense]MBB1125266.1 succinate dehydrogenase iron-sulfur subunit [Thiospirillum jenense]